MVVSWLLQTSYEPAAAPFYVMSATTGGSKVTRVSFSDIAIGVSFYDTIRYVILSRAQISANSITATSPQRFYDWTTCRRRHEDTDVWSALSISQWLNSNKNEKSTQRAQTSTDAKFLPKVIRDSYPDFRVNRDPDVCRICPTMLRMHYLVDVSHFAKYGTNRPLIVWEMLTNVWVIL